MEGIEPKKEKGEKETKETKRKLDQAKQELEQKSVVRA
jgi:hypothetical protein